MRLAILPMVVLFAAGSSVAWAQGDLIFADGFEAGNPDAWSAVVGYVIDPVIDLRADVNRNGTVDLTDPSEDLDEDTWDASHGAIFLANVDDDESACPDTGTDPELAACHDAADDLVNGTADLDDLARLRVAAWANAPQDASAQLVVAGPGNGFVRLFRRSGAVWSVFDPVVQTLTHTDLREGVELAIEATDIVRDSAVWDGFVDITLDVEAGTGPSGPLADGTDTVRLRVAPVLFRHHLDPVETVYVSAFSYASSVAFRTDLATAAMLAGVPNPLWEFWSLSDQWTQDFLETAYMSMPSVGGQHTIHINFRSANFTGGVLRSAGRVVFTELRGPDVAGAVQYDPDHSNSMDTLNSFGNLETIPPFDDGRAVWPVGRVVRGGMLSFYPDESFDRMIDSQGYQPVIHVDTSWLLVAHIDETISFVKTSSPRGWSMLVADTLGGWNALVDAYNSGYGSVPMFVGKTHYGGGSAEIQIGQVVTDQDLVAANTWAIAEVDGQIAQLTGAVGIQSSDMLEVPSIFEETSGYLVAYVPGMVNGVAMSDAVFAAPDPHGPEIGGVDLFKDLFAGKLAVVGYTPAWVENWDLYHRLLGEVHCGSNVTRAVPVQPWWGGAP